MSAVPKIPNFQVKYFPCKTFLIINYIRQKWLVYSHLQSEMSNKIFTNIFFIVQYHEYYILPTTA